jgi:hypothetical protein
VKEKARRRTLPPVTFPSCGGRVEICLEEEEISNVKGNERKEKGTIRTIPPLPGRLSVLVLAILVFIAVLEGVVLVLVVCVESGGGRSG